MEATDYHGWRIVASSCLGMVQVVYVPLQVEGVPTLMCNTRWRSETEAVESIKGTIDRLGQGRDGRPTPWPGGEGAG